MKEGVAGGHRDGLCYPLYFSDGEASIFCDYTFTNMCSNVNLFGCLMEIVFFFRGSVVEIYIALGSAVFVFWCKGSFNSSRCFLGKQSIQTCELC